MCTLSQESGWNIYDQQQSIFQLKKNNDVASGMLHSEKKSFTTNMWLSMKDILILIITNKTQKPDLMSFNSENGMVY